MAMGKRDREDQESSWVATADLPIAPGHPFYERLNKILSGNNFDRFVETRCRKFYAARMGRPSLAPAVYFRLLLIGYFEGIDSERGIAWRVADSMALRRFVGYALTDSTADHSTISRAIHADILDFLARVLTTSAQSVRAVRRSGLAVSGSQVVGFELAVGSVSHAPPP